MSVDDILAVLRFCQYSEPLSTAQLLARLLELRTLTGGKR